jgi:hypothetical protein
MRRGVSAPARAAVWTVGVVVLLYGVACLLPAIDCGPAVPSGDPGNVFDFESGGHLGLELLLFGWGGGNNGVPWSANVALALGLLGLWAGRYRDALLAGAVATALGLTTSWVRGHNALLSGYYLWQGSHLALAVGAGWALARRHGGAGPGAHGAGPAQAA